MEVTDMNILGWVLIVMGILFVLLGLANAGKTTFSNIKGIEPQSATGVINAVTELIKTISAAPIWLGTTAVGFALIYFGTRLASGLPLV
jgi:sulfite exporter TauE/SafE